MKPVFANIEHQAHFEKYGYVKLPLLEEEDVKQLNDYYFEQNFDNKIEAGFHISLDNLNSDLVGEVGKKIRSILEPASEDIFSDTKVFTASYVIKEPGLKNIVPPHQDWTFVNEPEYCSLTMWTALVDVNEDNGALGVIPGSHRLFQHHRSSPSPQSKSPLADHIFTLFPYVEIIEMKAGETLIFDNRLIHASPPNLTDKPRVAVGIGVTQKEAQLIHYYHVPETNLLNKYEVDESFYPYFNNKRLSDLFDAGQAPEGLKRVDQIERIVPDLSKEEMEQLVLSLDGVEYNRPLMEKLAKLFNYSMDGESKDKKEVVEEPQELVEEVWQDDRSFFQKYSPGNVVREIAWRMKGRPE